MPDDQWFIDIHQRLLGGDPVAPAELAIEVFEDLVAAIESANKIDDPDLIQDACTEAWENYVKNPATFNPSERSLFGYLKMSAQGDLRNRIAKESRRRKKENAVEDVELSVFDGNEIMENEFAIQWDEIERRLESVFDDLADRQAARLIIAGERATSTFVDIFSLHQHSPEEQRKEVKRQKDRIKKNLQRSMDLNDDASE